MPATQAIFLKGSKLMRKDPTTGAWEYVPQMRIVPVPSVTQQYVPSTNHDSEGGFEEEEPTIKTGDELPCNLVYHYDIPVHRKLFDDMSSQTKIQWRALFPGGVHGYEFEARLARFGFSGGGLDYTQLAELQCALKVTGAPTQF